jgi:cytochrome P450
MLIDATDEHGKMSDQQLRDEVMTMFIAGHQTTASALSWTWYLLGRHPESTRAVREEVKTVLAGRTPQFSDLPRLAVTKSVIEEAMRLYPPIWFFTRVAAEDGLIGGRMVPAGGVIAISPYVIHRNPATWSRPDAFDPARFQKGAPAIARCAYVPFGDGAHMCIGNNFAMAEMQLIVAMMMQAFEFTPCSQKPVAALPRIALSPRSTLDARVAEARG